MMIVAALAAVASYANTPLNGYCEDGVPIVETSDKIMGEQGWSAIWTTDYWSHTRESTPNRDLLYRPVTLSTFRLVRLLAGPGAFWQHLVNVALHALCAALLLRLCLCVGLTWRAALAAGLFFAVMPIHTDVLNSVVGRSDLLVAAAVMGAVLMHLSAAQSATSSLHESQRPRWKAVARYAGAAACAWLAMGAKENGIAAAPLVVLADWLLVARGEWRGAFKAVVRSAYLAIPVGFYGWLRYAALDHRLFQSPTLSKTVNVLADAPAWQHVLGVLQLWGMYWAKTFLPLVLTVKYSVNGIGLASGLLHPHVLLGAAVAVAVACLIINAWRRGSRGPVWLALALLVAYLPTSNALVLIQVFFAERIWYVPSLFAAALVGTGLARLARGRRIVWVVSILVAVGMMGRCWIRNGEWRHNGILFAAAYRDMPDAVAARHAYGAWLVGHGEDRQTVERGIALLQAALEIDPGLTDAHRALGRGYAALGDMEAALRHLQIADMQVPGDPVTTAQLDAVRQQMVTSHGAQLDELRAGADAGLEPFLALIEALCANGLLDEAISRFEKAPAAYAREPRWQHAYAITLVLCNEVDAAVERYRQCIGAGGTDPAPMIELAMLLLERRQAGDVEEADDLARRAEEIAPESPAVLHCRAEVLAVRGDLPAARALMRRAIDALPADSAHRRMLVNRAAVLFGE